MQQDMLDGKYGKGTAYAMKIQVAIGECFDAERMVPITKAHVALSNQDADLWFCEKLLNEGAHCRVTPTVNPGFCYDFFTKRDMVDPKFADLMQRTHNAYKAIGAELSYNCTPYIDTNVPMYQEVIAFSESSATPYVNAVWGARSNREGANSALCAAVTGFVPEYGLLLDENRKGDILVEVQADLKTPYDYHILGMLGKKIGDGIPVFTGMPRETITKEALRNLGAELNTSGAYGMYHILGVTPEAPDMETAFGGKAPKRTVVLTNQDMEDILKEISLEGNRKIDFAMPWLFNNAEQSFAAMDGDLGEYFNQQLENVGIHSLGYSYNGLRSMTNSARPITCPDDLKGLKMRVMENQVFIDFFNTLGASATPMSFSELFTGLQQHTVDGQENPPSLIYATKFQEVQKYLSVTEHVNNFLGFIMNKDFFDNKLTAEQQTIVSEAAAEFVKEQRAMELKDTDLYVKKLEEEGMEVNYLSDDQKNEFKAALAPMYEKYRGEFGSELFDMADKYNK